MNAESQVSLAHQPVRFVDLGHCQLAYRVIGAGPPLLFIHGFPLSGLTFRHIVPALAQHFTCIVPDLPGLGETIWTDATNFALGAQAETLKAFADALSLAEFGIVAHDTGATIARRLALIDPARVTRMALIGTEIPGHRPPWIPFFQRTARPNQTRLFRFLLSQRWFRRSGAAFGGCFANRDLIDGHFFDLFIKPLLAEPHRITGQTLYLLGIDWTLVDSLREGHGKITAPVLLIWGADDPIFPVPLARDMAKQFAHCAGFVAIPGGKTFVHEEMPQAVVAAIGAFLLEDYAGTKWQGPREKGDLRQTSAR